MSKHHDTPAWLRAIQRDGGPVREWHHEQGDSAPFQGRAVPLREAGSARAPRAAGDPAERPEMGHTPRTVAVASGAGRIECSCGWRSRVSDDGDMFLPGYYSPSDQRRDWEAHVAEPPRTGGHLDAPERPYRVYRAGDRIAVTVSAEPLTLAEAMNLCAALLAATAPMHRATLPKERI